MPLYEYECDACHQRFEVIQKSFSDPPPEVCARCGKGPVRKMLSTPAIQFKGSGWYVTDYGGGRSSAASSTSSSESGEKKESEKASSEKAGSDKKDAAPAKSESSTTKSDSSSSSTSSPSPSKKD